MPTYSFPSLEYVNTELAKKSNINHTHTPASIGAAASSHNHSASNITSGTLPISRGGTGGTNPSAVLNNLGFTTYTVGVNSTPSQTGWYEVARCTHNYAENHNLNTTVLVSGPPAWGTCLLSICLRTDGTGYTYEQTYLTYLARNNKMTTGLFAMDTTSEPGVAILYVKISSGYQWYNFKVLHQQCWANYTEDGTDILALPRLWVFKTNYGTSSNTNWKSSISRDYYC